MFCFNFPKNCLLSDNNHLCLWKRVDREINYVIILRVTPWKEYSVGVSGVCRIDFTNKWDKNFFRMEFSEMQDLFKGVEGVWGDAVVVASDLNSITVTALLNLISIHAICRGVFDFSHSCVFCRSNYILWISPEVKSEISPVLSFPNTFDDSLNR